jgi:RNA polymerase sigma-70 factor, ECF subfamily
MAHTEELTDEFVRSTDPFRRELLAHCYRMLGSVDEAEDLVQETYLRAWRAFERFEGRSSVRSWLYRIATNACLNALEHSSRRVVPSGLFGPSEDPYSEPRPANPDIKWLQPMPDALTTGASDDPASIVTARESLRLALIVSLQYLPARQRAVLILRDVLAFPARDVAQMLGTSVPAIKSALQRARGRLEEVAPTPDQITEPEEAQAREILQRYIAAFENSDAIALEKLLRDDVALETTTLSTWFAGLRTCMPFLATQVLGSPGHWRMLPAMANGQPAVAVYYRKGDAYQGFGITVLTLSSSGITGITTFSGPDLLTKFGMPLTIGPA